MYLLKQQVRRNAAFRDTTKYLRTKRERSRALLCKRKKPIGNSRELLETLNAGPSAKRFAYFIQCS